MSTRGNFTGEQPAGGGPVPLPGGAPPEVRIADAAGAAATYSRSDHTHRGAVTYQDQIAPDANIIGNRASGQSATAAALVGATNLGNDSTGAAAGVTANYATIVGGDRNEASGVTAATVGGLLATASGARSSVTGGQNNVASANNAHVSGGKFNEATGLDSSVVGGQSNLARAEDSAIVGGATNQTALTAANASIMGGVDNQANGTNSHVSGGATNVASGESATIGGGSGNTASGQYSRVDGGSGNTAAGASSAVVGADNSATLATRSHVAGGTDNQVNETGENSAITGGSLNQINNPNAHIGGGVRNRVNADSGSATGIGASSKIESSVAFASGQTEAISGNRQVETVIFRGDTPGVDPDETVELGYGGFGSDPTSLGLPTATNTWYALRITVISSITSGAPVGEAKVRVVDAWAYNDVGIVSIYGVNTAYTDSTVAAVTHSFTLSTDGADKIVLTGGIGDAFLTQGTRWVAKVELTEIKAT